MNKNRMDMITFDLPKLEDWFKILETFLGKGNMIVSKEEKYTRITIIMSAFRKVRYRKFYIEFRVCSQLLDLPISFLKTSKRIKAYLIEKIINKIRLIIPEKFKIRSKIYTKQELIKEFINFSDDKDHYEDYKDGTIGIDNSSKDLFFGYSSTNPTKSKYDNVVGWIHGFNN